MPPLRLLIGTSASNQRGEIPYSFVDIAAETTNILDGWTSEDRWLACARMPPHDAPRSGIKAVVVNEYQSEDNRGLPLDVGDEVVDIERSTLTWWFGWYPAKGVNGVFPKYLVQLKTDESEQSDDDEPRLNHTEPTNSSSDASPGSIDRTGPTERTGSVEPAASTPNQISRRQGLFGRFTSRVSDQPGASRSR